MEELDSAWLQAIRRSKKLPSPPAVAVRLIELSEDPLVSISEVIEVVSADPVIAAQLLRLSNSPLYARRRRAENLRQAVMVLGIDAVFTAALSLTLVTSDSIGDTDLPYRQFWTSSVHSATAAQVLANRCSGIDAADAFLAALLQDIGVLVIGTLQPDVYSGMSRHTHDDLRSAERRAECPDHAVVGAALLRVWGLPDRIVAAVRDSHTPTGDQTRPSSTLARVIASARALACFTTGDVDDVGRAAQRTCELLGLPAEDVAAAIVEIGDVIPQLAGILNADVPEAELLEDMAHEAVIARQILQQAATAQLRQEVNSLTQLAADLRNESMRDPLTGLGNRRYFEDRLSEEFSVSVHHGFPLSILFADLDDFKAVNDRLGHLVGDQVLTETARRMRHTLRDGDVLARFGGEEFVVVLPGSNHEAAVAAATRLVAAIGDTPFAVDGLSVRQTMSVGVAAIDRPTAADSPDDLIDAADRALYSAKRTGKNRWVSQRSVEHVA